MNLKKVIIIFFTILLLFLFISSNYENNIYENNIYENYISKNYKNLNLNDSKLINLSLMDEDLKKVNIVLAGEIHNIKYNYELKYNIIKYLNKKYNFRYIWIECPYWLAQLLNYFFETGDSKYLSIINDMEKKTFIKLYNYNKKVKDNKKLKFIGFDVNVSSISKGVFWYLNYIFKDKIINDDKISIYIDIINQVYKKFFYNKEPENKFAKEIIDDATDRSGRVFYKFIFEFNKNINDNKDKYKNILGSDYDELLFFVKIQIENYFLLKKYNFSDNSDKYISSRDKLVYKRFINYYNKHLNKNVKIFGQFGRKHLFLKKYNEEGKNFLIYYLNSDSSPFKNKILSIKYFYINCFLSWGLAKNIKYDDKYGSIIKSDFVNILLKYAKNDLTLFKLNGKDSPFIKKGDLIFYYPKYLSRDLSSTDFCDYIIIVKNSGKYD